ncbi:MAG: phytanoyl-CoA dioxygenase family protein [Deltaproteobacteria bacterium]|nr:phytanoyl-CoA dioxygenase family protein [Deltaproteobacteria bacterium]
MLRRMSEGDPAPIDDAARERYATDGWLTCRGLMDAGTCAEVLERARVLVARASEEERLAPGWPSDMMGRYLLSKEGAVPFWEPALGDPFQSPPEERLRHVARLGHALHAADVWLGQLIAEGPVAAVAAALTGGPVRAVQSVLMLKNPRSPVGFSYHHDGAYIRSEPESLVVAWLSLDGAPEERGGLRLIPGSHRQAPPPIPPPIDEGVAVDLEAGDAAFWAAGMLHASRPNLTDLPRSGLIAYFVARDARCVIEPCRPGA